jgi:hypothetical protein
MQAMAHLEATSRIAVAVLAVGVASAALAASPRRGAVAFNYARSLSPAQLDFYARFDVLVTHDPLPEQHVAFFRARGTKLVLYEWSVAFYESLVTSGTFQRQLLDGDRSTLLNHNPLRGGAGSKVSGAFYYDPASVEHQARARAIARRLESIGYDGVFFDTTTVESVHPEARAEYERRHPELPYDEAFACFLAALRHEMPSMTIVTNQGYRSAAHYLPYSNYDITESLITHPREDRFVFRPWDDSGDPWNSFAFIMRAMIDPVRVRYPKVRFVHLNYLDTMRAEEITTIIAAARLFGDEAFVTSSAVEPAGDEIHDDYFIDLGEAKGPVRTASRVARRDFEHGSIAVNFAGQEVLNEGTRIPGSPNGVHGIIRPARTAAHR